MKISEILNERTLMVQLPSVVKKIPVLLNPTPIEFNLFLANSKYKEIRGMMDENDFYVFDSFFGNHPQVAEELGLVLTEFLTWEIEGDEDDEGRRNIQKSGTITQGKNLSSYKYYKIDDNDILEFMLIHPTFSRIAKTGRYTYEDMSFV